MLTEKSLHHRFKPPPPSAPPPATIAVPMDEQQHSPRNTNEHQKKGLVN